MTTFSHIAGAEPSTVTFKAATVTQTRNSTVMHQEIISLGDPNSSAAIAECSSVVPSSTQVGLVTKEAGGFLSSLGGIVAIQGNSTVLQGTNPWVVSPAAGSTWTVRALQSSAADLNVTVAGYSTIVSVANQVNVTVSGNSTVAPLAGSTWATRPLQSSAADLQMTATPLAGSTWATRPIQSSAADLQVTATIGANLQSTVAPSSGSSGLVVRPVIDAILTTASTNAFASTSFSVQSSGAGLRSYVTAYSITSTVQAPTTVKFYSSGTLLWPIVLAALSSAVTGANLAVSAPAYLFRTGNQSEALTLQVTSSVAGFRVGISYFRAP